MYNLSDEVRQACTARLTRSERRWSWSRFGMPIIWLHPATMACLVVLALAMPRHPPKVHLGNRKWWAISDGTVGTTARVREVLLLTLICWQSVHSWSLVSVPRSVLLKIDQLEFIPLESYEIKNSGWYGENRWLWLFLSSVINVMSMKNNKFIFNVDCLL